MTHGNWGGDSADVGLNDCGHHQELIALYAGGLESDAVVNRQIALKWVEEEEIDYYTAIKFYYSLLGWISYIQSTETVGSWMYGGDPANYLLILIYMKFFRLLVLLL